MEFALGINRLEIHESTHQPLVGPNAAPGLTLGIFGQWFTRNETWAEDARPWVDYLARSSFLLQQGHFYADVAYFYGEEGPLTALFGLHPQGGRTRRLRPSTSSTATLCFTGFRCGTVAWSRPAAPATASFTSAEPVGA